MSEAPTNADRNGSDRCSRCGAPRDTTLLSCSRCLKRVSKYSKHKRQTETKDPMEGFDNSVPMEIPLENGDDEGTDHRPGTAEKVLVMCTRYDRGLPLFRLDDAEGARSTRHAEKKQTTQSRTQ